MLHARKQEKQENVLPMNDTIRGSQILKLSIKAYHFQLAYNPLCDLALRARDSVILTFDLLA